MQITVREVLVSIAITFILIGFGFLISEQIQNEINESNEIYFKALKINNNTEMFKYAIKTNLGNTLIQGKIQAVEGVSIEDINGKFFKIKKVKENYTKHTRQVSHTKTIGNKTKTYYTTEEYWTWDYAGQEEFHTERFNFIGVDFDYKTITFNNETYKETKSGGYHIRYKYYVIPFEFEGTLFTEIKDNTITENKFYYNQNIEDIISTKEKETDTTLFWVFWIILICAIDFTYIYFDNNYLEDREVEENK